MAFENRRVDRGEWLRCPTPDPFSYTSELGTDSYEGESMVRRFNLTHEWLAQVVWYCVYAVGGFAGLSLWKGVLLSAMFAILGLLVYRDTGLPLVAVAAVLGGVPLATMFASDRPTLVTFAMVATFVLLLELHDAGVITKETMGNSSAGTRVGKLPWRIFSWLCGLGRLLSRGAARDTAVANSSVDCHRMQRGRLCAQPQRAANCRGAAGLPK